MGERLVSSPEHTPLGCFGERFRWWVMGIVNDSNTHNELLNAPEVPFKKRFVSALRLYPSCVLVGLKSESEIPHGS